jgi:hypothetical protein
LAVILIETLDGDYSTIRFRYDPRAVEIMKSVPVHRWNPADKYWTTETSWVQLLAKKFYDAGYPVQIDSELWEPGSSVAGTSKPIVALFAVLPIRLRVPVFRALTKVLHPDMGGDVELMKQLNQAMENRSR